MTCHCDFKDDCCCQEEVHKTCPICKNWKYIAAACLVLGIVVVSIIRLRKQFSVLRSIGSFSPSPSSPHSSPSFPHSIIPHPMWSSRNRGLFGDIWGLFQADGLEIIALWITGYGIVNQSSLWGYQGLFQANGLEKKCAKNRTTRTGTIIALSPLGFCAHTNSSGAIISSLTRRLFYRIEAMRCLLM